MERSHSWPSAPAWKAGIPQGIVGSNPTLSAVRIRPPTRLGGFLLNKHIFKGGGFASTFPTGTLRSPLRCENKTTHQIGWFFQTSTFSSAVGSLSHSLRERFAAPSAVRIRPPTRLGGFFKRARFQARWVRTHIPCGNASQPPPLE